MAFTAPHALGRDVCNQIRARRINEGSYDWNAAHSDTSEQLSASSSGDSDAPAWEGPSQPRLRGRGGNGAASDTMRSYLLRRKAQLATKRYRKDRTPDVFANTGEARAMNHTSGWQYQCSDTPEVATLTHLAVDAWFRNKDRSNASQPDCDSRQCTRAITPIASRASAGGGGPSRRSREFGLQRLGRKD